MEKKVGVLALQGGVSEHIDLLKEIENVSPIPVKKAEQIPGLDALIIPGGESTTIGKLLKKYDMIDAIKELKHRNKPIWGTCAGLILLADKIENEDMIHLGLIEITVKRNAFGSQLDSFITKKIIPAVSPEPVELVFIRAPIITAVGEDVRILAKIEDKIVAAEKDNILVTSFHPELTDNPTFHQYFINKIIH